MRLLDGIIYSKDMNLSRLWEMAKNRESWNSAVLGGLKELDTAE